MTNEQEGANDMTTTTGNEKLQIYLSDHPPVRIVESEWPVIGLAIERNGSQPIVQIRVRQHADGRVIVYGTRSPGNGGTPVGVRETAGYLLPSAKPVSRFVEMISCTAISLGCIGLANSVIDSLPTEDI